MSLLPRKGAGDGALGPIDGGLSGVALASVLRQLDGLILGLSTRRCIPGGDASPALFSKKHTSTHLSVQRVGDPDCLH